MLEREYEYFKKNLPEFLVKYHGRFVLIVGEQLKGVFDNQVDAIAEGQRISTLGSYFVSFVGDAEPLPMRFNPWVGFVGAP